MCKKKVAEFHKKKDDFLKTFFIISINLYITVQKIRKIRVEYIWNYFKVFVYFKIAKKFDLTQLNLPKSN